MPVSDFWPLLRIALPTLDCVSPGDRRTAVAAAWAFTEGAFALHQPVAIPNPWTRPVSAGGCPEIDYPAGLWLVVQRLQLTSWYGSYPGNGYGSELWPQFTLGLYIRPRLGYTGRSWSFTHADDTVDSGSFADGDDTAGVVVLLNDADHESDIVSDGSMATRVSLSGAIGGTINGRGILVPGTVPSGFEAVADPMLGNRPLAEWVEGNLSLRPVWGAYGNGSASNAFNPLPVAEVPPWDSVVRDGVSGSYLNRVPDADGNLRLEGTTAFRVWRSGALKDYLLVPVGNQRRHAYEYTAGAIGSMPRRDLVVTVRVPDGGTVTLTDAVTSTTLGTWTQDEGAGEAWESAAVTGAPLACALSCSGSLAIVRPTYFPLPFAVARADGNGVIPGGIHTDYLADPVENDWNRTIRQTTTGSSITYQIAGPSGRSPYMGVTIALRLLSTFQDLDPGWYACLRGELRDADGRLLLGSAWAAVAGDSDQAQTAFPAASAPRGRVLVIDQCVPESTAGGYFPPETTRPLDHTIQRISVTPAAIPATGTSVTLAKAHADLLPQFFATFTAPTAGPWTIEVKCAPVAYAYPVQPPAVAWTTDAADPEVVNPMGWIGWERCAFLSSQIRNGSEFHPSDPPASPVPGGVYVIGDTPTGAWAGRAGMYGYWRDGFWRFDVPDVGDVASGGVYTEIYPIRWDGSRWADVSARTLGITLAEGQTVYLRVAGAPIVGQTQHPDGGAPLPATARVVLPE